jgi:hypothetical protein
VACGQLQQWYRTLDKLYAGKPERERELFLRLRARLSLKAALVFYALTSTYFAGPGPPPRGRHGYRRDGKPRERPVLVGQLLVEGGPMAPHVFAGNGRDATTVAALRRELAERSGLRRVSCVGDRAAW